MDARTKNDGRINTPTHTSLLLCWEWKQSGNPVFHLGSVSGCLDLLLEKGELGPKRAQAFASEVPKGRLARISGRLGTEVLHAMFTLMGFSVS